MQFRRIKAKQNSFLLVMSFMCFFLVWSCKEEKIASKDPLFGTGALSFKVEFIDGTNANLRSETAKIDCAGQGIATVEAKVYKPENTKEIASGGPWNCDAGSGTIRDVPIGNDRTIVVCGKNADGDIISSGQKSGFAVTAGSDNDAGIIKCYAFVPNLTAPANDAVVKQGAVDLQWEAVAGATEYRVFVSQNSDLSDPVIEDHPASANSTPSGLTPITTNYWQVFAVDRDKNWGIGSQIRSFTVAGRLPDTGQNSNYTLTFGEDSDYAINPPTYIKLDTSGTVLPDDADDWAMVKDDITGLTWEEALTYCETLELAEKKDWRLPNINELQSIVDYHSHDPAVDKVFFPDTQSGSYWSSTSYAPDNNIAWDIDFTTGDIWISGPDKTDGRYVRAVRGGE